ncbi:MULTISPECIES: galactokinase [Aliiglaciecola]|uniref:galactokinase n=1 Tax=Aliiglaciecola TaxID=1406885 RepID=UPI001C0823FF|nr:MULTISPECIES: galactokinase [Aliiglaciecola]MBU2876670.1 galactokinase [Aliiglaciecola lipolytica]MDO6710259.1 galactokinase [Aliiglaciecola sp. 2_MG-2023]MDO6751407.1 galactokinase [Aliiglaciecola sp. 1_MG-2023]
MLNSQSITEHFKEHFKSAPEHTFHAPGRVNLIGEHTDYNDGFVLPAAINFGTTIAVKKRNDRTVNVLALDIDNETDSFSLDAIEFNQQNMWSNYVRGTLKILLDTYPDIKGADILVSGNVPQGTGLSSSASFENVILKTFSTINNIELDGVAAALMSQKAENTFVGCNCGIMDQLVSAMGKEGTAMLLDCRSLEFQYADIPKGVSLVIINSNVKRTLVGSEYNTRRQQCEAGAKHFNKPALRDVTIEELESERDNLEPLIYQRAKHIVTENARTMKALTALNKNDMSTMSVLMAQSHESMKNDFDITTPELDTLVDIVAKVLRSRGGARMTGGGFGGCVIALTPDELVDQVNDAIKDQYSASTGLTADIYVCTASDGAFFE